MQMLYEMSPVEKVKLINHILYETHGFSGNTANHQDPQNSYLSQVLESRKGNQILLAVIYSIIAQKLDIPVYSIGAGAPCDGQLIICGDMLGLFQAFTPKFVKKYANVAEIEVAAFKEYVQDVKTGKFPTDDHVYHILKGKEDDFAKMLKEFE